MLTLLTLILSWKFWVGGCVVLAFGGLAFLYVLGVSKAGEAELYQRFHNTLWHANADIKKLNSVTRDLGEALGKITMARLQTPEWISAAYGVMREYENHVASVDACENFFRPIEEGKQAKPEKKVFEQERLKLSAAAVGIKGKYNPLVGLLEEAQGLVTAREKKVADFELMSRIVKEFALRLTMLKTQYKTDSQLKLDVDLLESYYFAADTAIAHAHVLLYKQSSTQGDAHQFLTEATIYLEDALRLEKLLPRAVDRASRLSTECALLISTVCTDRRTQVRQTLEFREVMDIGLQVNNLVHQVGKSLPYSEAVRLLERAYQRLAELKMFFLEFDRRNDEDLIVTEVQAARRRAALTVA